MYFTSNEHELPFWGMYASQGYVQKGASSVDLRCGDQAALQMQKFAFVFFRENLSSFLSILALLYVLVPQERVTLAVNILVLT